MVQTYRGKGPPSSPGPFEPCSKGKTLAGKYLWSNLYSSVCSQNACGFQNENIIKVLSFPNRTNIVCLEGAM